MSARDADPIDVVVAWVDGSDPAHAAKRAGTEGLSSHSEASLPTRFAAGPELSWCIASVLANAPYVRRIHVVTDEQIPPQIDAFERAGLTEPGRIRVVDHAEIFEGTGARLPTFNSLTIEAAIHRVPGLAERFVYFNDDFFLNRPLGPEAFFDVEGRPVLHGEWAPPDRRRPKIILRKLLRRLRGSRNMRPSYRVAHELGAALAGMDGDFLLQQHFPHPMRRSTIEAFHAERPEVLPAQGAHRYRHRDQYLPASLANHLEIARHGARPSGSVGSFAYYKPGRRFDLDAFCEDVARGRSDFGCIQSLDEATPDERARIERVMRGKLAAHLPG